MPLYYHEKKNTSLKSSVLDDVTDAGDAELMMPPVYTKEKKN
jgi:hypothetical protein